MTRKERITSALTVRVSTMPFARLLGIVIGVCTLVGLLAGAARWVGGFETKSHADSTFVRKDSAVVQQAGIARRYSVDSVARMARDERIDSALAVLVRACIRKGDCR